MHESGLPQYESRSETLPGSVTNFGQNQWSHRSRRAEPIIRVAVRFFVCRVDIERLLERARPWQGERKRDREVRSISQICEILLRIGAEQYGKEGSAFLQGFLSRRK